MLKIQFLNGGFIEAAEKMDCKFFRKGYLRE